MLAVMPFLPDVQLGVVCRIVAIRPSEQMPECARQLRELGFLAGEQIVLLRRVLPGGDPMVVRIGTSTFALRRAEAECIEVDAGGADA